MIAAVELVRDKKSREPFSSELRMGYRIYLEGLKRGVFMRPLGNVIYFIPPLIIMEKEIETMIDAADASIRAVLEK
jgi:adenosylmethionine-8-amino-7-oxononanoate aminotransferase